MKRNKNKPGKKRGIKSWLSIGAVVLVSVITLGIVAALISPVAASGSSGSGGGTSGNSTGSVSNPNIENAPVVSYRLFNEVYFDEAYTVNSDSSNKNMPNVKIGEGLKYGTLDTSNGYLEYSLSAKDNEMTSDSEFGIYLSGYSTPENEVSVGMGSMDYLVVDFDMWSNNDYFPLMYFTFDKNPKYIKDSELCVWQCPDENYGTIITPYVSVYFYEDSGTIQIIDTWVHKITDQSDVLHITILMKINQGDNENIRDYLDGNHLTTVVNSTYNISDSVDLQVVFPESTLNNDYSVCFDNFQFCAYGVGDGSYDGDISKMLNNVEDATDNDCFDIKNCRDWVLYGKYE